MDVPMPPMIVFVTTLLESMARLTRRASTKNARITIALVLVQSKHKFWIKEMALHKWINMFLPKCNRDVFPEKKLQKLHNWVGCSRQPQPPPASPCSAFHPIPANSIHFF